LHLVLKHIHNICTALLTGDVTCHTFFGSLPTEVIAIV